MVDSVQVKEFFNHYVKGLYKFPTKISNTSSYSQNSTEYSFKQIEVYNRIISKFKKFTFIS